MAADYPPLNKFYTASYAANDRDFPIVAIRLDPRTAGYRVPEDLSPHPDSKRYPNHVFTGAQPSSGDQVVTHIYEILPAPWVPFTRYDDDLGPIQGRRRSVKNEGQVASLAADKRVTYEAREGSAIVYNEIEESWSIAVDEDGNSLFPIRDRDFYDASRGAVQERRQLFVPTGEEEGTLENIDGVITQTSYEPYNEFLSVKIVQTYKVNGPQLVGNTTNNEGQLLTVTTQRKGVLGYVPPNPTATKTVEVSREDAESLVERIVDAPEVFDAKSFSIDRPDPIPQKFRVLVPTETEQETLEGTAEMPSLSGGEISKSEQQVSKFVKRISASSRDETVLPQTLTQKATNNDGQVVTITETLQSGDTNELPTAVKTIQSEALGDGNYVITKTEVPEIFAGESFSIDRPDPVPQKFRIAIPTKTTQSTVSGQAGPPSLLNNQISKTEQQTTKFTKRISTTQRDSVASESLEGQVYTSELGGGIATVTESFGSNVVIDPQFGTISEEKENLGNDQFVTRKVALATPLPELKGQNYDDTIDVTIPFVRQFIEAGTERPTDPADIDPRDTLHSVVTQVDIEEAKDRLLNVFYAMGEIQNISLPNTLTGAKIHVDFDSATSGDRSLAIGSSASSSASASVSASVQLVYDIRDGYSGPCDATRYLFFLPKEDCSIDDILSKISVAEKWPILRPKTERLIFKYSSSAESASVGLSLPRNESVGINASKNLQTRVFDIPPTLHERIVIERIDGSTPPNITATASVSAPNRPARSVLIEAEANIGEYDSIIEATDPPSFPIGKYLYGVNISPYRFGLVRVEAVVVDVVAEMV